MRYQDGAHKHPHFTQQTLDPQEMAQIRQNTYDLAHIQTTLFGPQGDNGIYGDMRILKRDVREILHSIHSIQNHKEITEKRIASLEETHRQEDAASKHRWKTILDRVVNWMIGMILSLIVFFVGFWVQNGLNLPTQ